jgi:hypothetical protein
MQSSFPPWIQIGGKSSPFFPASVGVETKRSNRAAL